jgi:hypothetical protein
MNAKTYSLAVLLLLFSASCSNTGENSSIHNDQVDVDPDSLNHESDLLPDIYDLMLPLGNAVVETMDPLAIENLLEFAHPEKGILFSPYLYIHTETALRLTKQEILTSIKLNTVHFWGEFDGSGDPIELTFLQYFNRFVYDKPYKKAPLYDVNMRVGSGNSLDNTAEVFPNATFIEFHFDGFDPELNGLDWRSLRMVFEKYNDTYYLVAIIHDEWTI